MIQVASGPESLKPCRVARIARVASRTLFLMMAQRWSRSAARRSCQMETQKNWLVVFRPTPLKNDGVRQLGWWHSYMESHNPVMFQSPPMSLSHLSKTCWVQISCWVGGGFNLSWFGWSTDGRITTFTIKRKFPNFAKKTYDLSFHTRVRIRLKGPRNNKMAQFTQCSSCFSFTFPHLPSIPFFLLVSY